MLRASPGCAGASKSSRPRSTATSALQATIGLVTEAKGKISSTSPASASTRVLPSVSSSEAITATGKSNAASAGRAVAAGRAAGRAAGLPAAAPVSGPVPCAGAVPPSASADERWSEGEVRVTTDSAQAQELIVKNL